MSQIMRVEECGDSGGNDSQLTPSITEGVALSDELQDGDNSLEPGELVTPPHQPPGNASPALKKMLAKDVMNKALRKLTQIDTDNCEEKERAILELEAIRRKEAADKVQIDIPAHSLENGCASAAESTHASTDDADDSEGLYSDTDSSETDQRNVEDVQKARKEKEAEAAAAAAAPPPPAPHHPFLGLSPLRFHMRPPCFDFSRMGFMPRMPRGGMRGMRPPFYNRPPAANRGATPRGATPRGATPPQLSSAPMCNGPQGQTTPSSSAYGPVLPPGQAQGQNQGAKRPRSDLIWTTSQPPVSFFFNLVSECGNVQHRSCKQKEVHLGKTDSRENQAQRELSKEHSKQGKEANKERVENQKDRFKDKHRERSKETRRENSKERHRERFRENRRKRSNERQEDRSKEINESFNEKQSERSKEKKTERSKEKSDKPRDQAKDDYLNFSKEKQRDRSKDQLRGRSKERKRERCHSKDKPTSRSTDKFTSESTDERSDRFKSDHGKKSSRRTRSRSKSRKSENRVRTPPMPQLPQANDATAVQDEELTLTPPPAPAETCKAFDIFAESPPRLNKAGSPVRNRTPPAEKTAEFKIEKPAERSTTPPLEIRHIAPKPVLEPKPSKTTTPQLKIHSEIHIRIGALLEDNDLHLETLLATKEQLLRKSTEHRNKKEAPKEMHIKQEPPEPAATSRSRWTKSRTPDRQAAPPRHANPFKRDTVLTETSGRLSPRRSTEPSRRSMQRNGDRHSSYRNGSRERDSKQLRHSDEFRERIIKQEKNRSKTPPMLTARQIKVERDATPPHERDREVPVRNGVPAANVPPPQPIAFDTSSKADQHSPDTDDYIDNWENDDSMAGGDSNTPKNAASTIASRLNGDDDDSNALWNAKSTPPPRAKLPQTQTVPQAAAGAGAASAVQHKELISIQDVYEKFMKSIKTGGNANEAAAAAKNDATTNSSLSNSTAEESSSDTEATTSSSSSSSGSSSDDNNDDDDDEDDDDESSTDNDDNAEQQELKHQQQLIAMEDGDQSQSQSASVAAEDPGAGKQLLSHKKNNVSKDLRKLKSLEDNLARIQMMRENYDSGDDICEELLKMESLFLMQRNAIMNKYRKPELKPASEEDQQQQLLLDQKQQQLEMQQMPRPLSPVNNIFDANREAIKLTISPLKLTRKPAIFDKDEPDMAPQAQRPGEKLTKPPKEIAIVKPTIMDTRAKPSRQRQHSQPPQHPHQHQQLKRSRTRERSRSRSVSRNRFRRHLGPGRGKDSTRSPSPRRRRPMSPRRGRFGKPRLGGGRSRSRSASRSRTRSRSPLRRRRNKPLPGRRRSSLSPPCKMLGPRSPPPPTRRRSYSRERCYSRSPLPFKPPSPPMRRSWSTSRSRSPSRRRSRTRSRTRSRSPHGHSFTDYFVENQGLEAVAYYYNMSLMQQDASGEHFDSYAAYVDTAYNMEQAYAQYTEYSATAAAAAAVDYDYGVGSLMEPSTIPVLRELPMAPIVPVAVQKGNVLEIVPSMEASAELANIAPVVPEEPPEDKSKPKRKRVNFVDNVLPNYESDSEDRKIVEIAVERAVRQYRERCAAKAAKLQRKREQLLAMPAPLPPVGPKPTHLDKPVLVQKKPRFRYYHFDPIKGAIVKSRERLLRPPMPHAPPRFDPKYMAMLVKSGRLPMPAFMRHHPPPLPAQADAMLQEFFSKHPPPPLHHVLPHYLRGPPPMTTMTTAPPPIISQPIPVLGAQSYTCYPQTAPPVMAPVPTVTVMPAPVPVPVPAPVPLVVPVLTASPLTSTPPPSLVAPFFTPPPLPTLSSHFTVQPVPTMREIMPVDILQKIGPLPKTLDLDVGNPSLDEAISTDLKEAETAPPVDGHAVVNPTPPQLLET